MKTQFMVDLLAEFARNDQTTLDWWNLYVDGVSNVKASEANIVLKHSNNITLKQTLNLNFNTSKNQVE